MSTTVLVPDPIIEIAVVPTLEGWVEVWWDCSVYVGAVEVFRQRYYSESQAFTRSISRTLVVEDAHQARARVGVDFGTRLARVLAEA